MKTIKIKDIEISAEELRRIVSENKELLNEPEVKGRYFFPKEGEIFWIVYHNSGEIISIRNDNTISDKHFISIGNCYRTEAEAQLALDKQKAIVACWKWAQENAPFEPNWGDKDQNKYYVAYSHMELYFYAECNYTDHLQFTLPYFKSEEDTNSFIEACKEHLTLLFTK